MKQCYKTAIVKNVPMSVLLILVFFLSYHFTENEQFQSKLSPFTLDEGISSFGYLEGRLDSLGLRLRLSKKDNQNLIFDVIRVPGKKLDLFAITPLTVLVIKQCKDGTKKVVSQQYHSIRSNRRNCIKVSIKESQNGIISFGCFMKEDLYRNKKEKKCNIIFYQYIYENQ